MSIILASFSLQQKSFILLPRALPLNILRSGLWNFTLFSHGLLLSKDSRQPHIDFWRPFSEYKYILFIFLFHNFQLPHYSYLQYSSFQLTGLSDLIHTIVWLLCMKSTYIVNRIFYYTLMEVALDFTLYKK